MELQISNVLKTYSNGVQSLQNVSLNRIRAGKQTIIVMVPRKPGRAGIDPD